MAENCIYDEALKETKRRARKKKFDERRHEAALWFERNKEWVVPAIPVVIGVVSAVIDIGGKHLRLRREKTVKDLYCYDNHLGHYWRLRRELTNAEWLKIVQRRENGEELGKILEDLKVLK